MSTNIPELRTIHIRKTVSLQNVLMQPLFLFKVSHNGEIGEDHQQTMLKRFLISAPNEIVAKHWFTLNILNHVEDLTQLSKHDLDNIYHYFNYRFIKNEFHICLETRRNGFKDFITESIYIKKINTVFHASCLPHLNNNKILAANFDLTEFQQYLTSQIQPEEQSYSNPFRRSTLSSSAGFNHTPQHHQFAQVTPNIVTKGLHAQSENNVQQAPEQAKQEDNESFASMFAKSQQKPADDDNENKWNREEYNKNQQPKFGYNNNRFGSRSTFASDADQRPNGNYLRKRITDHPDSSQPLNQGWVQTNNRPTTITRHQPLRHLINKD